MRFFKLGSLVFTSALALGSAACGFDMSSTPAPARDAVYEGYRAEVERTLRGLGFADTVAVIEDEPVEAKATATAAAPSMAATPAKGKPNPSASSTKKAASPSPSKSAAPKTKKVIEATFIVPGTKCAGNVEQELEPVGKMYFAEVILPDGTEKDVKSGGPTLAPFDIFKYVHDNFAECAIAGVTAPPPVPTASGTANMGSNPSAVS